MSNQSIKINEVAMDTTHGNMPVCFFPGIQFHILSQ